MAGGRSNLWRLTGRRPRGRRSRARTANQFKVGEAGGSVHGAHALRGHLAGSEGRWDPTSPAHSLAIATQERIDPEALLQGCCPPKSPRLPEPFLPQKCEHRIVCLALHTRREQPEVTNVVPVAVGHVIRERGQELRRRVRGLDGTLGARVFRHKSDFLTINRPEPVLRDGRPAGVTARIAEELLLASEPLDIDVPPPFVLGGE